MARLRHYLRQWYDRVPDWLWPHLTGACPAAPREREFGEPLLEGALLESAEQAVRERLLRLDERVRTTESKLLSLLTLTSILSAAVTAGFVAACTVTIEEDFPRVAIWISCILLVYLGMNLLRSVWSTVSGLVRRGFAELPYGDLLPKRDEPEKGYRNRLLQAGLANAEWNDWVVDQKVSELAVAHVALRNALCATGGVMVMSLVIALLRLP